MGITVLSSAPALTSSAPADDVAAGPSVGVSTLAARGDHAHRTPPAVLQTLLTASAPLDADLTAAAVGTALLAAKGDHRHMLADSGWQNVTLQNGWTVYGDGSYGTLAVYRKVGSIVFLRGLLTSTAATAGTAFTLPAGYRPAGVTRLFGAHADSGFARYDVSSDGRVTGPTGRGWVSFSGITFLAEV
jgi:hypothetical protein